jgi:putative ABC transport system substrate-binding protein
MPVLWNHWRPAAKNATQTIPIVMMATDPVELGLVGSLSRPRGNVTGLSLFSEAIMGKRLELLKELVPGLARIGVLRNPLRPADPSFGKRPRWRPRGGGGA